MRLTKRIKHVIIIIISLFWKHRTRQYVINKHKKALVTCVTWSPCCHQDRREAGLDVELMQVIVSLCPALTVGGLRLMFSDLGGTAQQSHYSRQLPAFCASLDWTPFSH